MVIVILSIFPESAEPERTFSGARRTCLWDRLSLKTEKIEIIECLGSWLREELIKQNCFIIDLSTDVAVEGKDEAYQNGSDVEIEMFTFLEAL